MLEFTDRYGNKMYVGYNDDPVPEVIITLENESYPIDNQLKLGLLIAELQQHRVKLKEK